MRILLLAYEFPPVLAAQALRWHYLANELGRLGVEVDVLTPALRDIWRVETELHPGVSIFRCFPGPFVGLSGWLAGRRKHVLRRGVELPEWPATHRGLVERTYRGVRKVLDQLLVPDVRTEWFPFAWRRMCQLHALRGYELVVSSHEPGVDLLLGLAAKRKWALPWIADLGDPVVTPYTPRWRRSIDRMLERGVCNRADAILVTTEGVKDLLVERHGVRRSGLVLIRQGFDHREMGDVLSAGVPNVADRFVLVFTGTFYRGFREPTELIAALTHLPGVDLILAGDMGPFANSFKVLGDRVRLLGKRPHSDCLKLQRSADILINIGNSQDYQVPGKVYEYLGARRPILHIAGGPTDPVAVFLARVGRGIGVSNNPGEIAGAVEELYGRWCRGELDQSFDLADEAFLEYSWAASARRLYDIVCDLTLNQNRNSRHTKDEAASAS